MLAAVMDGLQRRWALGPDAYDMTVGCTSTRTACRGRSPWMVRVCRNRPDALPDIWSGARPCAVSRDR
jgi:hypothetical protein